MKQRLIHVCISLFFLQALHAQQRIVSLNGTISEIVCALGQEQQIAGVDITSNYPPSLLQKPRVGHNRNISAEAVLSLQPTLVLTLDNQLSPQLADQLRAANVKTVLFKQELTLQGARKLMGEIAQATGASKQLPAVQQLFDKQVATLKIKPNGKKVLFIYARGAGTLMVSGTGTSIDKIITLAGAQNAMTGFADFKPLSAESLVAADPDVILLFDSGLKSIGGIEGLLKVPGIAQTKAGKNKQVISMDGELLSSFGIRLPQAIQELNNKLQ